MVAFGGGMGCTSAPNTDAVMGAVPREQAGLASGTLTTMKQVGAAFGVAVIGSLLVSGYRSALAEHSAGLGLSEQPTFKRIYNQLFGLILRRHEMRDFTGATYMMVSSVLCVAFFPPDICFCALAFLSIGDTFAAIVGMNLGKRKLINSKKSVEGTLACFASTFIFGLFFIHPLLAFVGALAASISELLPIPVDDNIRIPLASGLVMLLFSIVI
jgi:dolichol kinase